MNRMKAIWHDMKVRCSWPKHPHYDDYGGRGIRVCKRWLSFDNFLADMGEPPDGCTLDRINNDGNYEPGNCRWATWTQQNNNRRGNVRIEINGEVKTISEWAKHFGVNYASFWARIRRRKWNAQEAGAKPLNFDRTLPPKQCVACSRLYKPLRRGLCTRCYQRAAKVRE